VSNLNLSATISAEEIISSSSGNILTTVKEKVLTDEIAVFSLTLDLTSHARMNISYGDGHTDSMSTEVKIFSHSYSDPGNYTVTVLVYNSVSETNIVCNKVLNVRKSLNSLSISASDIVSLPQGEFKVTVSSTTEVSGMDCDVKVADLSITERIDKLMTGESASFVTDISTLPVGDHIVDIICSDSVSSANFTVNVLLLEGLMDLRMTLSNNITQVGDMVEIMLEISAGTNCSFAVSYGNGDLDVIENTVAKFRKFTYSYTGKGFFMIRGTAANSAGELQTSQTIKVIEPLPTIDFGHSSIDLYTGNTYPGTGDDKNKYNLDRKLLITANDTSDLSLRYSYKFDYGQTVEYAETEEPQYAKKINSESNVTITCTVTNDLLNMTNTIYVQMVRPVKIVSFLNDGKDVPIVASARNVTFTLKLKNPSYTTCLFISIGNTTFLWGETVCEHIYTMQAFIKSYSYVQKQISPVIKFHEMYGINDTSSVEAIVFNEVSRSRYESHVSNQTLRLKICVYIEIIIYVLYHNRYRLGKKNARIL